jgi:fatty-acyl-CoA synthase
MAVPRSGAVLHTVNLRLDPRQIGAIMAHAGDRVLFVDPSLAETADAAVGEAPSVKAVVVLGELPAGCPKDWIAYEDWLAAQSPSVPNLPTLSEEAPAALCYSSATTGRPKGVTYTHRALYLHSAMLAMADTWGLSHRDTVLPVVPMFHVNAWGIPFTALWMGSKIVLPGAHPTAETLAALLVEEEVTFAAAVPTIWMDVLEILQRDGAELPAMRLMVSGGAPLPGGLLDLADRLGLPLIHSYGMTEASPLTHVSRRKANLDREDEKAARRRRLRQGLPVPGLSVRVVDPDGDEVPHDGERPGELLLRGPWVAEEYLEDDRSAGTFDRGWYRSGDIVTVDPEGYMLLVDRTQDLIKSGGEWISSIELESALSEHEEVARAAAVAVPHPRWQERPLLFVEPRPGCDPDPASLRAWLAERFPRWWVPESVEIVAEIPITTVGKIDKRALRLRLDNLRDPLPADPETKDL